MLAGNKGKAYPAFWGYLVHDGVTLSTGNWIEKSQLPVILDLDETLLVAHSASQLQSDIARLSKNRYMPALFMLCIVLWFIFCLCSTFAIHFT